MPRRRWHLRAGPSAPACERAHLPSQARLAQNPIRCAAAGARFFPGSVKTDAIDIVKCCRPAPVREADTR